MLYQKLNLNPISDSGPDMDIEIVRLIAGKQYAEAYQMLNNQTNPTTSNLYNLSICMYIGEAYEACILQLDKAYEKLKPYMNYAIQGDEISQAIQSKQRGFNTFLNPVTDYYVSRFPCTLKNNILRLKIECLRKLEMWDEIVKTSHQLTHKNYKNVEEALAEIELCVV